MASLTVVQLREALTARNLDTRRLKATLVSRLQVAMDQEDVNNKAVPIEATQHGKELKPPSKSPFAMKTFQGRRDGKSFKESRLMSSKKSTIGEKNNSEAGTVSQDGLFQLDLEQELEDTDYTQDVTLNPDDVTASSDCEDDPVIDDNDVSNWIEDNDAHGQSTFDEEVSKCKTHERRQSYGDNSAPINIVLGRISTTSSNKTLEKSIIRRRKSMEAISER